MRATRVSIAPSAVELEYRLLPRWWQVLLVASGAWVAGVIGHDAHPTAAVFSYGAAIVTVCVFSFYLLLNQRVRVTKDNLILPRARWSREEVSLPFSRMIVTGGGRPDSIFIDVAIVDGGTYTLWSTMFRSDDAFHTLCHSIHDHIAAARAASSSGNHR